MDHGKIGNIKLDPKAIRLDRSTHARAAIDEATVEFYAMLLRAGTTLPPPVVFFDGTAYWIGDGHHRVRAALKAGLLEFDAHAERGDRREAIFHAVGADPGHGLPRTDEDKRRAVLLLLEDEVLSRYSNRSIARRCRVTESMVRKLRDELAASSGTPTMAGSRARERDGTTYAMWGGLTKADRRPKPAARTGHADAAETAASTPPIPQGVRLAAVVGTEVKPLTEVVKGTRVEAGYSDLDRKLDYLDFMFDQSLPEHRGFMLGMLDLLADELTAHWPGLDDRDPLD